MYLRIICPRNREQVSERGTGSRNTAHLGYQQQSDVYMCKCIMLACKFRLKSVHSSNMKSLGV